MANARNLKKRGHDQGRDSGGFVALPWAVLDCPAYGALSHPARSLLLEFARQYVRDNNGRLLASGAYLRARGWTSSDVITRAVRELVAAGFIFQTAMGHRPNKASWYAVTWRALDKMPGFDAGTEGGFIRGAYQKGTPVIGTALTPPHGVEKNATLTPPHGVERPAIAPPHGVENVPPTPSHGAIRGVFGTSPTPLDGDHLETPSTAPTEPGIPGCCIACNLEGKEKRATVESENHKGSDSPPSQQSNADPVQTAPATIDTEPPPFTPEQTQGLEIDTLAPLGTTTTANVTKGRKRPATEWVQFDLMEA